ncbi:ATP/GTP-binding protein [Streptomyces sp. NPDC051664]|uniref:ATP/GTP-binding protein n=1 Tax=Streptomyces sp. NPDC051664 TaxID=3365668 RepID=UPI003795B75C
MAAVLLSGVLAPIAYAKDGPTVGNEEGCRGSLLSVTVCAQDGGGSSGSSGSRPKPAAASSGNRSGKAPKCTYEKAEPQPPAESLTWDGHKPGDGGAVYRVMCPATGRVGALWIADGGAPAAPAIDPEVVARQAVDSMKLIGPDMSINPKPGGKGLVGMPVWMAVDQSPTTYGPNTASATAGGVTVSATAKVTTIAWSMGDGTTVKCTGPGTVYKKSYGLKASPDCGHRYKQPSSERTGGTYKVTATATWSVDWQVVGAGGETGQLTEIRDSEVALTIVESQAVN